MSSRSRLLVQLALEQQQNQQLHEQQELQLEVQQVRTVQTC